MKSQRREKKQAVEQKNKVLEKSLLSRQKRKYKPHWRQRMTRKIVLTLFACLSISYVNASTSDDDEGVFLSPNNVADDFSKLLIKKPATEDALMEVQNKLYKLHIKDLQKLFALQLKKYRFNISQLPHSQRAALRERLREYNRIPIEFPEEELARMPWFEAKKTADLYKEGIQLLKEDNERAESLAHQFYF